MRPMSSSEAAAQAEDPLASLDSKLRSVIAEELAAEPGPDVVETEDGRVEVAGTTYEEFTRLYEEYYAEQDGIELRKLGRAAYEQPGDELTRFTRSNLLVAEYEGILSNSSMVMFVAGGATNLETRLALRAAGFEAKRIKSALLKMAIRRLDPGDVMSFRVASRMAAGVTEMVYCEDPLSNVLFAPDRLKQLKSIIPLEDPDKGNFTNKALLVGAYMRAPQAVNKSLWFSRPGFRDLMEVLEKERDALGVPLGSDGETFSPDQMFQAKFVGRLRGQLSALRAPLQRPGQAAAGTVRKIPESIASTLAKVRSLRQDEAEDK